MRNLILAAIASLAAASAAQAGVTITSSAYDLAAPAGAGVLIDFDDPTFAGFTLSGSGYLIQSGDNWMGAAPAAGPTDATDDPTKYLSVYGGYATLMGTSGFHDVSLFWGSMDGYNALDLLDGAGNVFHSIVTSDIPAGSNGDQLGGYTNRRVNIASTDAIYGLTFRSTQAAFEADNVKFTDPLRHNDLDINGAVPEPASWATMVLGFGVIGGAVRKSKRGALARA